MSRKVLDYFIELVQIDSESGREGRIAEYLSEELRQMGAEVYIDRSGDKYGSEVGNVYGWIAGAEEIEPLLLCAHMDTVTPGRGVVPVIDGAKIRSRGRTILGADDKSGIAMILASISEKHERGALDVPIEIIFTISEEIGLLGAKSLDYGRMRAQRGYVLDGNLLGEAVIAAPYQSMWEAKVKGKSAHAGIEPEAGRNAVRLAAQALLSLRDGRIDEETTMNTGMIRGGKATNIVCDEVIIKGEIRSHDKSKLEKLEAEVRERLEIELKATGYELEIKRCFNGYRIDAENELVSISSKAYQETGIEQKLVVNGGGSDANVFREHGMECLVVGTGMQKIHTLEEFILVEDLEKGKDWLDRVIEQWSAKCRQN